MLWLVLLYSDGAKPVEFGCTLIPCIQTVCYPSSSFTLSSSNNEEVQVQFVQNHVWDNLQIDVSMAVIHHVENTSCNKEQLLPGQAETWSFTPEGASCGGSLSGVPQLWISDSKKYYLVLRAIWKQTEKKKSLVCTVSLLESPQLTSWGQLSFFLSFFFSCTLLWSVLHEGVIVYFESVIVPVYFLPI